MANPRENGGVQGGEPHEELHTTTVVSQARPRVGADRAILTVTAGPDVGRVLVFPPDGISTIGRAPDCTFQIPDAGLSRVHARVARISGSYVISDAGSTNGTYVGGQRLAHPVALKDGDRIQLGARITVRFSLVDESEQQALQKVFEAGRLDALTGVANRRQFEERLETEVAYAVRHEAELSLVMIDIDHFKRINDGFGHPAGDAVLRAMGRLLLDAVRTEDLVARYGGEEFALVLRGTDVTSACLLADRIRASIKQSPVAFDGREIGFTSSAGVASIACCTGRVDRNALVAAADERLYRAKRDGRDRVVGPA